MNRLYQWLQERATFFRMERRDGDAQRTVRTQVTVEEQQRTMILTVTSAGEMCVCPLCGHAVDPMAGATVLEGAIHAQCTAQELQNQQIEARLGTAAQAKKAVRRLR